MLSCILKLHNYTVLNHASRGLFRLQGMDGSVSDSAEFGGIYFKIDQNVIYFLNGPRTFLHRLYAMYREIHHN